MTNEKKICPLLTTTVMGGKVATVCQREKCAWWIEDKRKCAISVIGGVRHGK
jgi:hypothetical protein